MWLALGAGELVQAVPAPDPVPPSDARMGGSRVRTLGTRRGDTGFLAGPVAWANTGFSPGLATGEAGSDAGPAPREECLLEVSDTGIGIHPRHQERIFERFYRVDPARHRSTGGTGLGLSIVKHVAATHGGEVKVWSVQGQGSTFTLVLPRSIASLPEQSPSGASPSAGEPVNQEVRP